MRNYLCEFEIIYSGTTSPWYPPANNKMNLSRASLKHHRATASLHNTMVLPTTIWLVSKYLRFLKYMMVYQVMTFSVHVVFYISTWVNSSTLPPQWKTPSIKSWPNCWKSNEESSILVIKLTEEKVAEDDDQVQSEEHLHELFNEEAEIQESNSPEGKRKLTTGKQRRWWRWSTERSVRFKKHPRNRAFQSHRNWRLKDKNGVYSLLIWILVMNCLRSSEEGCWPSLAAWKASPLLLESTQSIMNQSCCLLVLLTTLPSAMYRYLQYNLISIFRTVKNTI